MKVVFLSLLVSAFAWTAHGAVAEDEEGAIPLIAVNQVGYQSSFPKRFTAPGAPDGASFQITRAGDSRILFEGAIKDAVGDFSDFSPVDEGTSYVVRIPSMNEVSFPFEVSQNLYQEAFWQSALDFMIDCRSIVGTHPSAYGGSPWRDGVYYSYEVPSLLWLYAADQGFWERAPRQIDWHAERARILDPAFNYDPKNKHSEGALEAARRYFLEVPPPADEAPDIIKLVHWGLGFYLMKPETHDPSHDYLLNQVHSQVVEQFAFLVYHWDQLALDRWLPAAFHAQCLDFVREHWESSGCFEIDPLWHPRTYSHPQVFDGQVQLHVDLHPYKGRHAPGHSILPNLFMYLSLRDSDPELAQRHLQAAQQQTSFIIEKLDWDDPRTTKGHRGSEFQTMLSMGWFLRHLPEHAPPGLQKKIHDWAKVAISRSNNMWDFRRYDLQDHWTIPSMNETGNLAAFPAAALSVASVIDDPALAERLKVLAVAHVDNLWGRNPKRAAACGYPEQGYPMVERGWPKHFPNDRTARLETCRGGLDASPGTEMYPDNPLGAYRHPEGWINWNASWNVGLAALELLVEGGE